MCPDCKARRALVREAFMKAKFAEAAVHAAKGAAEAAGLKKKTGVADTKKSQAKKSPAEPVNRPTGQQTQE